MALDAFGKLKDNDFPVASLLDAVDFYVQHHDSAKEQRTVQAAMMASSMRVRLIGR